jgi:hypothetical protein
VGFTFHRPEEDVSRSVAEDAIKQYEIAKRNEQAADARLQAGIAATAYLDTKDEARHRKWKGIQKQEAVRAGLPVE